MLALPSIIFFLVLVLAWTRILHRLGFIKQRTIIGLLFGATVAWFLLTFLFGFVVAWFRVTDTSLLILAVIAFFITVFFFFSTRKIPRTNIFSEDKPLLPLFRAPIILVPVFVVLFFITIGLLAKHTSEAALLSPWQTFPEITLVLFFLLTAILGILLFSRFRIEALFALVVLHTFAIHAYVPLSHELPWGGDVWRHIAKQEMLLRDGFIAPTLTNDPEWKEIFGADVPSVFISPQKYAYSHLWGSIHIVKTIFHISYENLYRWFMPIVWSLVFPVLCLFFGRLFFSSRRVGLILAWLTTLVFPLQAAASLTLPVSYDLLAFFLFLILFFAAKTSEIQSVKWLALLFGFFMLISYPLYLILTITLYSAYIIAKKIGEQLSRKDVKEARLAGIVLAIIVCTLGIFLFPTIEAGAGVSMFGPSETIVAEAKQAVGRLSGWFYTSKIRPDDILSGNILINHTPLGAHVETVFTTVRPHILPVSLIIWIFAIIGWLKTYWTAQIPAHLRTMAWLFSTIVGGYLIGWFLMEGDRLFIRRFDPFFSFLLLIFFLFGIFFVVQQFQLSKQKFRAITLTTILLFSWFGTTVLASGPDLRVVSRHEFDAANSVLQEIETETKTCVIADTWPLLVLEAKSKGKIVGGGFPIDAHFAQPERVALYQEFLKEPHDAIFEMGKKITGAADCFVIAPRDSEMTVYHGALNSTIKEGRVP